MNEASGTTVITAAARALDILDVFTIDDPHLGVSEIARRINLAKSTTQRLLKTLESRGYVVQTESAHWRLGPSTASLSARYQMAFDIREKVEPALRKLSDATGKNASFFVRDGNKRIRLIRVKYPDASQNIASVGESMPLELGAAGKVMLAALGEQGALYEDIRKRGFHITIGEARVASASIAVPVFGSRWRVIGALCIGAPAEPGVERMLLAFSQKLLEAAKALSAALSFDDDKTTQTLMKTRATWHP